MNLFFLLLTTACYAVKEDYFSRHEEEYDYDDIDFPPSTRDRAEYRLQMRRLLRVIPRSDRNNQSAIIRTKLTAMDEFKHSNRIGVYLSKMDEARTDEIVFDILALNKTCYIPTAVGDNMDMVRVKSLSDFSRVPVNQRGVRQPTIHHTREKALETGGIDLLIIPGVAFTREGDRIPRGAKDYFKDYIKRARKTCSPKLIGICLKQQIVPDGTIPVERDDIRMDKVITA